MRRSVWLAAIDRFAPDIAAACRAACAASREDGDFIWIDRDSFLASPSDSIDYAVMEKLASAPGTAPALVVPLSAGWSDIGAWDAVWAISTKDQHGNVSRGNVVFEDCTDTLVYADNRTVTAVGCDEMIIVESADVIMVAPMDKAQEVKNVVARLSEDRKDLTQTHRRVYRPWGRYESIDNGDRFQVKHIVVYPGAALSLQTHRHRAEHWVVVRGTAEVTRGDEVFLLTENQSTYVPVGEIHRLANPGTGPLEIIEVQSGSYLGEDDIVRLEDTYGRIED
jgi:mannose-1-phosphate guanylyltransferase / mannose-6-phosphate isomerase